MPILTPSSWNGRPIYPHPASPAFSEVSFAMNDAVAVVQSPFSMQMQVMQWVGADAWSVSVTVPPMPVAQANQWLGWAGVLRGKLGQFWLGDPLRNVPQGSPSGSPIVALGTLAMATIINTSGWTPNTSNLLKVGDLLQIGNYLHQVCGNDVGGQVNSDSSGNAQIEIWPSLRVAVTTTCPIYTTNPIGLFMLASNLRSYSAVATEQLIGFSFKAIESR